MEENKLLSPKIDVVFQDNKNHSTYQMALIKIVIKVAIYIDKWIKRMYNK